MTRSGGGDGRAGERSADGAPGVRGGLEDGRAPADGGHAARGVVSRRRGGGSVSVGVVGAGWRSVRHSGGCGCLRLCAPLSRSVAVGFGCSGSLLLLPGRLLALSHVKADHVLRKLRNVWSGGPGAAGQFPSSTAGSGARCLSVCSSSLRWPVPRQCSPDDAANARLRRIRRAAPQQQSDRAGAVERRVCTADDASARSGSGGDERASSHSSSPSRY